MFKKKILSRIEMIVSNVMNIDTERMLKSRTMECVDARALLIHCLVEKGFSDNEISRYLGITRQGVNKLKNSFDIRLRNFSFRLAWKGLSKSISSV